MPRQPQRHIGVHGTATGGAHLPFVLTALMVKWIYKMSGRHYVHVASFAEADIQPLRIGRRLWVGPVGTAAPDEPHLLPIWLARGPAFGAGAHPTTQLCLRVLERHLPPGATVLDVGAGSAILSLAAARLGATSVLGIDIDPAAVAVGRVNVTQNGLDEKVQIVHTEVAELLAVSRPPFTWVVANILAHVLEALIAGGLVRLIAPGGWLVLSGFLRTQTPVIRAAISAAGLKLLAQEQQDEWVGLIASRPTG